MKLYRSKTSGPFSNPRLKLTRDRCYFVSIVNDSNFYELEDDTGNLNYYEKSYFEEVDFVFFVGIKVKFGGLEGRVISNNFSQQKPVVVLFSNNDTLDFTIDGKVFKEQTESVLCLHS